MDVFNTLYKIDCNGHTEQKNGLTYLSWAWAWAEIKKHYPGSYYTIYENAQGWCYHTDGKTCWVKTGVTIVDGDGYRMTNAEISITANRLEHIEYLPVMDNRNKSIPLEQVTSFDVNKAIQRSLTKAAARHGLGLYIYAGEDLPESDPVTCADCNKEIQATAKSTAAGLAKYTQTKYGRPLCSVCATAEHKRQEAATSGAGKVIQLGENAS